MIRSLILDDHPTTTAMLGALVRAEGFKTDVFECPHKAMASISEQMPDICFLDWMLPDMTGLDVLKHIRSLPDGDRCYVIMLTAKQSAIDFVNAFDAGVNDYIAKPFKQYEVRSRLGAAARMCNLQYALAQRVAEVTQLNIDLKDANGELRRMSVTDGLTGLLNRRAGDAELQKAWSGGLRHGTPLAVVMADIDNFKKINDTYGHDAGDAVICHIANILRQSARTTDAVARFGGEEFLLVLPNTNDQTAAAFMERVRLRICETPAVVNGRTIPVTISAGVASWSAEHVDTHAMLKQADVALYQAKRMGRNRVIVASPSISVTAKAA